MWKALQRHPFHLPHSPHHSPSTPPLPYPSFATPWPSNISSEVLHHPSSSKQPASAPTLISRSPQCPVFNDLTTLRFARALDIISNIPTYTVSERQRLPNSYFLSFEWKTPLCYSPPHSDTPVNVLVAVACLVSPLLGIPFPH